MRCKADGRGGGRDSTRGGGGGDSTRRRRRRFNGDRVLALNDPPASDISPRLVSASMRQLYAETSGWTPKCRAPC
jgi:hypothetical protein